MLMTLTTRSPTLKLANAMLLGMMVARSVAAQAPPPLEVVLPQEAPVAQLPAPVAAQWRTQKLSFSYSGFTTLYTCSGLEDKVREILATLGARKDLKVRATGCTDGMDRPSRFAWVSAEFSALEPAGTALLSGAAVTSGDNAGVVNAAWVKVRLAPSRPFYMGDGECELVEQIRPLLEKGFSLRYTDYRTRCTPHQVSMADYDVKTEVLKSLAAAKVPLLKKIT